ncbi:bifunctional UDP-sugar hydrolase/5'-nucleotidase [Paenibacillus sp. 32352]|uniref:bifunctional metallophosphatase/5'-nucleotidase n=1 Tax=Paenibacillus sp. 32352 TaxID=1969111 RepID=UPI0009AE6EE5|nr:bifunctional UDP-sugar hydrolase/5'-nucleotidase [Paenibacillus sp. 32352]
MNSPHLRLRIIHSNDIHSHYEQMPQIAAAVQELRASAGEEHTLTLDIGDHLDRMRPETEASAGSYNLEVMAATGYEAVTLGNNEGLTFTKEALAQLYRQYPDIKVVCANLLDAVTGDIPDWAAPFHILDKGGIKIGLIGATAYYEQFYRLLGWDIQEPVGVIRHWVQQLRPQVDVLILMSHLGLSTDQRIAGGIPGIDVILGGHSHHLLEQPLRIGGTLVCGAGKFGQYIGVVDLQLDPRTRKLTQAEGVVRKIEAEPYDSKLAAAIRTFEIEAGKTLNRQVAYLERPLAAHWYEEAPLGSMLASALRRWAGAEIGIVNAGQFLEGLERGTVTAGRLLDICPSPINPCRMTLTGEQILQALEESLLPEFMEKPIYGFGFRCKVLGMLNLDGMTVEYDADGPPLAKIRQVRVGEEPLELSRAYTVGTVDMFSFGIGYLSLSKGTNVHYFLPEFLRDIMQEELNNPDAIAAGYDKHWFACRPLEQKDC